MVVFFSKKWPALAVPHHIGAGLGVVPSEALSSLFCECLGLAGAPVSPLYPDLPSVHDMQTAGDWSWWQGESPRE